MKFIDFFAGIGGFRRGLEMAGHECVGFCEWDKYAAMSYTAMHLLTEEQRKYIESLPAQLKKNGERNLNKRQKEISKEEYRNGEWYADDIRNVDAGSLPQADCWCFGAPCQDFSIAGKRAGLEGDRSSLIREIFRILGEMPEDKRPEWLLYENVKGMLSSNRGFDYLEILLAMDELGYDIEWQLFNSKDWGVPQNRERVYTIGHLRRCGTRKILPIEGADGENSVSINQIGRFGGKNRDNPQRFRVYEPNGIGATLSCMQGGGLEPYTVVPICNINPSGHGMNGNVYDSKGINPALTTNKGEGNKIAIPVLTPDRVEKRQNGRRFKEDGEPMFTLTAQDRHGVGIGIEALGVLKKSRTEYGKKIRKMYEAGKLKISRHAFTAYEIKSNGVSNTVSTVAKDNYLALNINKCVGVYDFYSKKFKQEEITGTLTSACSHYGSGTFGVALPVKEATKQGYALAHEGDSINLSVPGSKTRRGRAGTEVANTLDTSCNQGIFVKVSDELTVYAIWYEKYRCYIAIRRLTPRECFRLQGWEDKYFERAQLVNSDSQLYKQAGNGVTVNVVYEIGRRIPT